MLFLARVADSPIVGIDVIGPCLPGLEEAKGQRDHERENNQDKADSQDVSGHPRGRSATGLCRRHVGDDLAIFLFFVHLHLLVVENRRQDRLFHQPMLIRGDASVEQAAIRSVMTAPRLR